MYMPSHRPLANLHRVGTFSYAAPVVVMGRGGKGDLDRGTPPEGEEPGEEMESVGDWRTLLLTLLLLLEALLPLLTEMETPDTGDCTVGWAAAGDAGSWSGERNGDAATVVVAGASCLAVAVCAFDGGMGVTGESSSVRGVASFCYVVYIMYRSVSKNCAQVLQRGLSQKVISLHPSAAIPPLGGSPSPPP